MIDLAGIYYVLNSKQIFTVMGDSNIKVLAVGLGWAAADSITNNFLSVVFQGWANEFKSEFIINSISANIDIIEIVFLTFLAQALSKKDCN